MHPCCGQEQGRKKVPSVRHVQGEGEGRAEGGGCSRAPQEQDCDSHFGTGLLSSSLSPLCLLLSVAPVKEMGGRAETVAPAPGPLRVVLASSWVRGEGASVQDAASPLWLPWSRGWELPLPMSFPSLLARLTATPVLGHRVQLLPSSPSVSFFQPGEVPAQRRKRMEQSRWEAENEPCDAELILASSLPCAAFNHVVAV